MQCENPNGFPNQIHDAYTTLKKIPKFCDVYSLCLYDLLDVMVLF